MIDTNPIIKVRPAKVVAKKGFVLSVDDVAELLDATDSQRYGPVVALLFTSELRVSETVGLSWDDADLDEGSAMVRRCVTYTVSTGNHSVRRRRRERSASTSSLRALSTN